MTKISQYSTDVNITGNDKWIGSDAQNFLITKNFTPNNLAIFFNENNVIDIGTSIRYRYQTLLPGEAREQGTISFETEIGPQVNFSAITTFLIAKNTLKGNTVTQYLDFLVDGKVLLSKASNINIFGYYKITSIEPWIPNTNFFVVEVDFLSGNGFISEDLDYLVSLVDKVQDIPPPVWGSITGDIEDQTDLIDYISSQITTPTLSEVLAEGNTTGGENIVINDADAIQLENSSTLKKGTYDFGADGGISRICGVGFEDMWQSGIRHVFDSNGLIRNSTNGFNIVPDASFDNTLRFKVDSLWTLDNGDTYQCTDASTGAAVWELVNTGTTPTLQQVLDNNHDLVDGNNFQGSTAGEGNTGINVNALGDAACQVNSGNNVNALGVIALGANTGNNVNALGYYAGSSNSYNNVNLFGENAEADEDGQTVLSKDGTIMARISTTDLTDTRKYNLPNASGTIALTSDITTPTLQQVLDNNHDLVDGNNFQGTNAGIDNTGIGVNAFGDAAAVNNTGDNVNAFGPEVAFTNLGNDVNALGFYAGYLNEGSAVNSIGNNTCASNTGDNVNALGTNAGVDNIFNNVNLFGEFATADEDGQTVLSKDGTIMARISTTDLTATRKYNLPNASGTIALLSDVGVTTVTATSPITSSGGATPDISTSMATNKLIGRSTAGVGVMEEITIGTGLSLTGGTLSSSVTGGIPHATASGTDTYTATVTGVTSYADADAYLIRFTNGNTTSATLNINSLGAIPLYRNNDGVLIGGDIISGGEMLCVYNSTTNRFQVIGTAPNSLFAYVTNDDSVTLTKGMPVYAFSGTGDRMTVKRAFNTSDATSAQTVGLVLSTSIAANQKGLIMMQGLLDGLSILPTSTWSDGDAVYLGATAGTITNVKPFAPNHLVYLGVVTTASNGAAGRMYVRVQNGYELQELHNVQAQSPSLNDTLWYDNTVSPAQWKTASIPTILGYTPPNLGLVQAMTQGLQNIF